MNCGAAVSAANRRRDACTTTIGYPKIKLWQSTSATNHNWWPTRGNPCPVCAIAS